MQPDSQLVQSHKKYLTKFNSKSNSTKIKPLKFLDDDGHEKTKLNRHENKEANEEEMENDFQAIEEDLNTNKNSLLNGLFDQMNTTQMNDRDLTLLTPKKYKIFIQDTPVEYYGK